MSKRKTFQNIKQSANLSQTDPDQETEIQNFPSLIFHAFHDPFEGKKPLFLCYNAT